MIYTETITRLINCLVKRTEEGNQLNWKKDEDMYNIIIKDEDDDLYRISLFPYDENSGYDRNLSRFTLNDVVIMAFKKYDLETGNGDETFCFNTAMFPRFREILVDLYFELEIRNSFKGTCSYAGLESINDAFNNAKLENK